MKVQAVYVISQGPVRAEFRNSEVSEAFQFILSDKSGDLGIYMDNENEDNARLAVAALNGDLKKLRWMLNEAEALAALRAQDDAAAMRAEDDAYKHAEHLQEKVEQI